MIVEDCKIKRWKRTLKEDVGGEFFLDGALRHCRSEADGEAEGGRMEEGLREGGGGKERDLTRLRQRRSERDMGTEYLLIYIYI